MKDQLNSVLAGTQPHLRRNVMREYLQARVLLAMQERGAWSSLAFMGGTALRFRDGEQGVHPFPGYRI